MDLRRRCWSAKLCCRGSDGGQELGGSGCSGDDGVGDDCGEFGDVNKWDVAVGSNGERREVPHRQLRGIWSNFQSSANVRSNMVALALMSILNLACFFTPGRLREDAKMKTYLLKMSQMRESQLV